jgi:hypothetical protein
MTTETPETHVANSQTPEDARPADASPTLSTPPPNVALIALVERVSSFLDSVEGDLGSAPLLTPIERKRAAKPRRGAEKVLTMIAPIVRQHGLDSTAVSTDAMLARLADAETLQTLFTRLTKIQKRVNDELFTAQCGAWEIGLQFYALLKRRAKSDGTLATSLEPLRTIFSYRHSLVKKERLTKIQAHAKAELKRALVVANKHDVGPPDERNPSIEGS